MTTKRWMTGSLVGLALLTGSVAPAQARPRYGYDHRYDRHRHGNGFGFGDAVGIAALVGAVAIVASSASKDKQVVRTSTPNSAPDDRSYADDRSLPPARNTDFGADVRDTDAPYFAAKQGDDQMTDSCALAARDEAQGQNGGYAEVRHIDTPRASDGGYNIDGEVETRASYRATNGLTRRFTCTVQDGRVAEVYLSRDVVTR